MSDGFCNPSDPSAALRGMDHRPRPLFRGETSDPIPSDMDQTPTGVCNRIRGISMKITTGISTGLAVAMVTALSGCMGNAVGAAGTALAGTAATGAITSGSNRARFERQSCTELAAEIAGAQRAMINPLAIPSTQAYIRDARAVSAKKGCPEA